MPSLDFPARNEYTVSTECTENGILPRGGDWRRTIRQLDSPAPCASFMRFANPILALLAVVLIGCHTAPETVAYRTSRTAHITATAARTAWGAFVAVKHS